MEGPHKRRGIFEQLIDYQISRRTLPYGIRYFVEYREYRRNVGNYRMHILIYLITPRCRAFFEKLIAAQCQKQPTEYLLVLNRKWNKVIRRCHRHRIWGYERDLTDPELSPMARFCEDGNEPQGSIKAEDFFTSRLAIKSPIHFLHHGHGLKL